MNKPTVKLIGQDGNVFNLIGIVSKALRKNGQANEAKEFVEKAMTSDSYDEVLELIGEYVDIE